MDKSIEEINRMFLERYGVRPLIVRSPGRINLLGEHTDYNDGFVLPAAIDKTIWVAVQQRKDAQVYLYSAVYHEECVQDLQKIEKTPNQWPRYILGVVAQLQKRGYALQGFDLLFGGDVPIGAGVSSSAAVECAVVFALNELFNLKIPKIEMVKMAQLAEHEFAGVKCGIMDQFASMFGKEDKVIALDCRSLEYKYYPLDMENMQVLLLDTNVKHSLASSEYNLRREQCEKGVALIKQKYPAVHSLRDVTLPMLDELAGNEKLVFKRCKYVVEENARLQEACKLLEENNMIAFGKKMFETHDGLKDLYEVSCRELDFLVDQVRGNKNVLGARMMGGGFGGCTINLVKEKAVKDIVEELAVLYKEEFGLELTHYEVTIKNGTTLLQSQEE